MSKPVGISLVLCDSIYVESPTGKTALVGLFNRITGHRFPLKYPRLSVYASLTEVVPGTRFRLEIVNAETDQRIVELQGPPPPKATPLTVCDFNFEISGLVFPEPGLYFVRFWSDDHLIMQRPFHVTAAPAHGAEEAPGG